MVNLNTSSESTMLKYLTMEQVRETISSVKNARDRMMIRVLYETACTTKELARIKSGDVAGNRIRIKSDKNLRFSQISGRLTKDLSIYIQGNNLGKEDYLFSGRQSNAISEKRIAQLIKKYCAVFGNISPHDFRYYHMAHAYSKGVFIEEISEQLGLTKLRVFQVLGEIGITPKSKNYSNFLGRV